MSSDAERRFTELYEAYHRHVYAYFKRRTDVETAQEGTAETFLVAWRRLDRVPEDDRALPWLYSVARRVLSNHYRGRRRFLRLKQKVGATAVDPPTSPETAVVRRLEEREALEALGHLRLADQELLRLAIWEELPHQKIAEALGCSSHAVDQRIHRASKRLARELESAGHIPGRRATTISREEQGDDLAG